MSRKNPSATLLAAALMLIAAPIARAQEVPDDDIKGIEKSMTDQVHADDAAATPNAGTNTSGASHTESSTESSSVSVSVGVAPPERHDDRPRYRDRGPRAEDLVGKWQLSTASGDRRCDIELKGGNPRNGSRDAWVPTGCPDGFLPASSWKLIGDEIQIGTSFDAIGTFHQVSRNRWEGRAVKDGAPLVLGR